MNLGEMFDLAFRDVDERSINGTEIPVTNGNYLDIKKRMYGPADAVQQELAKITKMSGVYPVSQNPITNLLGLAFDEVQHFPGTTYTYTGTGAKSFSIEVDGACIISFDEYVSSVWTPLNGTYAVDGVLSVVGIVGSISVVPTKYTNYRGLLTIASALNPVRITITPTYPMKSRYRAMFAYAYATAVTVPWYRAYVPYDLPVTCLEFNKMMRSYDQRQFEENKDYKLTPDNKIHINWYLTGQFDIHYWKRPTVITVLTLDTYDWEIPADAQAIAHYFIGGMAIMPTNPSVGVALRDQYYALRDMLKTPSSSTSSEVVNTMWKCTSTKLF